jgi:hypothetical protein
VGFAWGADSHDITGFIFSGQKKAASNFEAAARLCFNDFGHFIVSNPNIGQIVALR